MVEMTSKCSYMFCGKSKRDISGLRTFSFPVTDKTRCDQWIKNSGNTELSDLTPQQLKRRFICESHFESRHKLVKKLAHGAVPVRYKHMTILKGKKVYEPPISTARKFPNSSPSPRTSQTRSENETFYVSDEEQETSSPSPSPRISKGESENEIFHVSDEEQETSSPSPRISESESENEIFHVSDEERELSDSNSKLSNKENVRLESPAGAKKKKRAMALQRQFKRKVLSVPRNLNSLSMMPRALTRMQLHHKSRSPWLMDEKFTALLLFCKSPSTYRYLRSKNVILPAPSLLSKWHKEFRRKAMLS